MIFGGFHFFTLAFDEICDCESVTKDDWCLFRESSFYNSKLETSHMLHDLEVRTVLCKIYPNDSADMLRHALPFCWDISHSISISIYHLGPRFGSAFQVYKPYGFRAMHFVLRFLAFLLAYGLGPQRQLATEVWPMKCPPSTAPGIRMASIVDVAKSQHLNLKSFRILSPSDTFTIRF
jgi:hypothetical protein